MGAGAVSRRDRHGARSGALAGGGARAALRHPHGRRLRRHRGRPVAGRTACAGGADHGGTAGVVPPLRLFRRGGDHGARVAMGLVPGGAGRRAPGLRSPRPRQRHRGPGSPGIDFGRRTAGDRLRGRLVPLRRGRTVGPGGDRGDDRAGRGRRARGSERRREDDLRVTHPPLLGRNRRKGERARDRRPGLRRRGTEIADRHRAAGPPALRGYDRREHRVRAAERGPSGDRGGGGGGARAGVHRAAAGRL